MFELPFDVEHEKLEHIDTYLSVGCLEPLPIPTEIVVGDDFATEAIDRVTTYLKGGEHHMFDGFPQKKELIYFQVAPPTYPIGSIFGRFWGSSTVSEHEKWLTHLLLV